MTISHTIFFGQVKFEIHLPEDDFHLSRAIGQPLTSSLAGTCNIIYEMQSLMVQDMSIHKNKATWTNTAEGIGPGYFDHCDKD